MTLRGRGLTLSPVMSRWLLGLFFITFLGSTVTLFFVGPWDYPVDRDIGWTAAFLVAVHLAFVVGYARGCTGTASLASAELNVPRLVFIACVLDLIVLFPTSAINTGHWIPNPFAAIEDLAGAYTGSLRIREASRPYINYVRILIAPILGLAVPLGVYYWNRLRTPTRILLAASVVGNLALFVSMGANAGAAHWFALFPWFVLASHLSGQHRLDARGWMGAAAVFVLSGLLFAGLFTATMNARTGSFAKHGTIPGIKAKTESPPSPPTPAASSEAAAARPRAATPPQSRSRLRVGFDGLAGYLTQGYFAVHLSLKEPFVPGYGVGNSVFLQRQAARILDDPAILQRPYPERIEKHGWNATGYWATIYPWIASDVTFPGTILVMLAIGWLSGRVWLDVVEGQNAMAVAFLGQLLILLYYIPAHNKVMHSGEGVVGFWGLLAAWVITRRRAG